MKGCVPLRKSLVIFLWELNILWTIQASMGIKADLQKKKICILTYNNYELHSPNEIWVKNIDWWILHNLRIKSVLYFFLLFPRLISTALPVLPNSHSLKISNGNGKQINNRNKNFKYKNYFIFLGNWNLTFFQTCNKMHRPLIHHRKLIKKVLDENFDT